uniref:Uncharacterized protein n=1 Tax=Chaetoceros debilis TaxID=122233 RepID=A0A7S3V6G4_9STRA
MVGPTIEITKRVKISYTGNRKKIKTWNAPNGFEIKGGLNKSQIDEKKGAHITYNIVKNGSESGEGPDKRCPGCFGKELPGDSLQITYTGDEKKSNVKGYFDITILPRDTKSTTVAAPSTPSKTIERRDVTTPNTIATTEEDPSLESKDSLVRPPSFPDISKLNSDEDQSSDGDVSWPPTGGLTILKDPDLKKNAPLVNFVLYFCLYMGVSFFVVYGAIHRMYQDANETDSDAIITTLEAEAAVSMFGKIWSIAWLGSSTTKALSTLGVTDSSWW